MIDRNLAEESSLEHIVYAAGKRLYEEMEAKVPKGQKTYDDIVDTMKYATEGAEMESPQKAGYTDYNNAFSFFRINELITVRDGDVIPKDESEPLDELRMKVAYWVYSRRG